MLDLFRRIERRLSVRVLVPSGLKPLDQSHRISKSAHQ
uniref:Uncharacterized protein n=1 Tax=Sphingomonas sp. NS2 TaxID=908605 RepID=A0A0D4ZZ40_9SPHN|nr:hypothetical protein plasmid201_112 [Sphingomonas sp. NS2]